MTTRNSHFFGLHHFEAKHLINYSIFTSPKPTSHELLCVFPVVPRFRGTRPLAEVCPGQMLGFHLSARSSRRSLGWIGPYIGSNRISRRGSKIQSKKTHQHHHHEKKMEDGSGNTQRKPVMVDPRNIPTYDLSAQAFLQKIETLYIFSHFFCVSLLGCFILSLVSCRVTYGLLCRSA